MTKKLLVLVFVYILVFPLGLTAKEKRGADLLIEKTDGQQCMSSNGFGLFC